MKKQTSYEILETHHVSNPSTSAAWFAIFLGADRGVPSKTLTISKTTVDVVADDNRAIRFVKAR